MNIPKDSPVEIERKSGENGKADWKGFDYVYSKLSQACLKMGMDKNTSFHIETMAALGSGHEERMKARLLLLHVYGWID